MDYKINKRCSVCPSSYEPQGYETMLDGKIVIEVGNMEAFFWRVAEYVLRLTLSKDGRKLIKSLARPGCRTSDELWKVLMYLMSVDLFGVTCIEHNEYYEKLAWDIIEMKRSKAYNDLFKVIPTEEVEE